MTFTLALIGQHSRRHQRKRKRTSAYIYYLYPFFAAWRNNRNWTRNINHFVVLLRRCFNAAWNINTSISLSRRVEYRLYAVRIVHMCCFSLRAADTCTIHKNASPIRELRIYAINSVAIVYHFTHKSIAIYSECACVWVCACIECFAIRPYCECECVCVCHFVRST